MYIRKRYQRKSSTRPYKKRAVKAVRKAKASRVFKKKVLSVVHAQTETKQAYMEKDFSDFNSSIAAVGDAMRIIPQVNYGTGDNNRCGDQIRAQKLTIKGIINMIPQTNVNEYANRKIAVRIMIVTPKSFPNDAQASNNQTTWMPYLLKKGGTTSAFNGTVHDLFAPINTEAFVVHYNKVIFLNQSAIFQSTASGVTSVDLQNVTKFFSKTFYLKNKLLKYDANIGNGITPSNWGPQLCLGYALTDPNAAPDTLATRVRFHFSSTLDYEDA